MTTETTPTTQELTPPYSREKTVLDLTENRRISIAGTMIDPTDFEEL